MLLTLTSRRKASASGYAHLILLSSPHAEIDFVYCEA